MDIGDLDIDWGYLLERVERLIDLGEELLALQLTEYETDPQTFEEHLALRWQAAGDGGYLAGVPFPDLPPLDDLVGLEPVLERLRRNTRQFLRGLPANHVLLRGGEGCGKSAAVKGLLAEYGPQGLRLVEVRPGDCERLPEIAAELRERPYRFVLFCDPLPGEPAGGALGELLDGGLACRPENLLVYATAPPRPEASPLAARFGLALDLPAMTEEDYLAAARHLAARRQLRLDPARLEAEAREWAHLRQACSGRTARQFVDDLAGRLALEEG